MAEFNDLHNDVLLEVLKNIPYVELVEKVLVNKTIHELIEGDSDLTNHFWREYFIKAYQQRERAVELVEMKLEESSSEKSVRNEKIEDVSNKKGKEKEIASDSELQKEVSWSEWRKAYVLEMILPSDYHSEFSRYPEGNLEAVYRGLNKIRNKNISNFIIRYAHLSREIKYLLKDLSNDDLSCIFEDIFSEIVERLMREKLEAPWNDYRDVIWHLAKLGVNLDLHKKKKGIPEDKYSPLSMATELKDYKMMEHLLIHGADPNYKSGVSRVVDVLGLENSLEDVEALKILITHGGNVNDSDSFKSLLHMEIDTWCRDPDSRVVELLVDNGADIYKEDSEGRTVLELAREKYEHFGTPPYEKALEIIEKRHKELSETNKKESHAVTINRFFGLFKLNRASSAHSSNSSSVAQSSQPDSDKKSSSQHKKKK